MTEPEPDQTPRRRATRLLGSTPVLGPLARRTRQAVRAPELLAARDDKIARLRRQSARLRRETAREVAARKRAQRALATDRPEHLDAAPPSFRRNLIELRRTVETLRPLDPERLHPVLQIARKLRNYRLAASHGVAVPQILGVWVRESDLDLTGLPDTFVLKSDVGAGGNGVFPLQRVGADRYAVIGGQEELTTADLIERYRSRRSAGAPFFAEAFLQQRVPTESIPDDVKIYAAYGEVLMVMVRRMPVHANLDHASYLYTDANGVDLGEDLVSGQHIDPSIPLPEPLEDFVAVARHLSRALAVPFVRVDVYDTVDGPVLGELTRAPGGAQRFRRDHDLAMGEAWDRARWRLDLDVIDGRPLRNLHGRHDARNYYPPGHLSHEPGPGGWEVVTADCSQWCLGGNLP